MTKQRKRPPFFLVLGGTLVVGAVVGGLLGDTEGQSSQARYRADGDTGQPQVQRATKRIWRDPPRERVWTVGDTDEELLYGSLRIKVDDREQAFVVDFGDLRVKRFDRAGQHTGTFGLGEGQGPGEFGTITDFFPHDDGSLWVADNANGRITIFEPSGEIRDTLRIEQQPYRIALRSTEEAVIMQPFGLPRLFARIRFDGQVLREFGEFLVEQERSSLALDGLIATDHQDGFVYAGHYASVLAGYSMEGDARFFVETIDPFPLPDLVRNSKGLTWVDREARGSAWGLDVEGDRIYVLSAVKRGLRMEGVIDVYALADGTYLYSMERPEKCQFIAVTAEHLYTADETTISKWVFERT